MSDLRRISHAEAEELAPLYVLYALDTDEMAAVRAHLATCPEPHPSFVELGGVVPALFDDILPVDAPASLRARVLAAIDETPQVAAGATDTRAEQTRAEQTRPVSIDAARERRAGGRWTQVLAAAAVILALVLGAGDLVLLQRASDAEHRYNQIAERTALLREAIAASTQAGARVAILSGTGPAAGASGFAAVTPSGTAYFVVQGLPQAPAGKTYEGWYIAGGKPTAAGTMDVGPDGLMLAGGLKPVAGTEIVALTVERTGGVDAPTSDPIVVGTLGPPVGAIALVLAPGL